MNNNLRDFLYAGLWIIIFLSIVNFTILVNKIYFDFLVFTSSFGYLNLIITFVILFILMIILAFLSDDKSKKNDKPNKKV